MTYGTTSSTLASSSGDNHDSSPSSQHDYASSVHSEDYITIPAPVEKVISSGLRQTVTSMKRVPLTWLVWLVQFISIIGLLYAVADPIKDDTPKSTDNILFLNATNPFGSLFYTSLVFYILASIYMTVVVFSMTVRLGIKAVAKKCCKKDNSKFSQIPEQKQYDNTTMIDENQTTALHEGSLFYSFDEQDDYQLGRADSTLHQTSSNIMGSHSMNSSFDPHSFYYSETAEHEFIDEFFESDDEELTSLPNNQPNIFGLSKLAPNAKTDAPTKKKRKSRHPRLLDADIEEVFCSRSKPSADLWMFVETFRQESAPDLSVDVGIDGVSLVIPIAEPGSSGYRRTSPSTDVLLEQIESLSTGYTHVSIRSLLMIDSVTSHRHESCIIHLNKTLPGCSARSVRYIPLRKHMTFRMGNASALHPIILQLLFWLLCLLGLFPFALLWIRLKHISRVIVLDKYYPRLYSSINVDQLREQVIRNTPNGKKYFP